MKKIDNEEFQQFLLKATYYVSAMEISEESKIDKSTISKYIQSNERHNSRKPGVDNQERIIRAILNCVDRKITQFEGDELEGAKELTARCFRYLLSNFDDLDNDNRFEIESELMSDYQELDVGYLVAAEEWWNKIREKSDIAVIWLDKYYDAIDKYFRMDLEYINNARYPNSFTDCEKNIVIVDELVESTGLKKTLNCLFFAKNAYDVFEKKNCDYIMDETTETAAKKRFIARYIEYAKLISFGLIYEDYDIYTNKLLNDINVTDEEYDEYMPGYPFFTYIELMLSITSEKWLKYGKYRFYVINELSKENEHSYDIEQE